MRVVYEVIGLGIGEETKGAWVEFLTRQTGASFVWRKGGPQSGHHLVLDGDREMMLSHFGAGVFFGVTTYVDMPIIPVELIIEANKLAQCGVSDPLSLLVINASCLVVTPFHQAINRLREILRSEKKGTIGLGVGEAIRASKVLSHLSIHAYDLNLPIEQIQQKVEAVRLHYLQVARGLTCDEAAVSEEARVEIELLENKHLSAEVADLYSLLSETVNIRYEEFLDEVTSSACVIETSHGAQLHPRFGYVPHVTQVDPTGQDALRRLSSHGYTGEVRRFGVCRSYSTRFGAGPFVCFDEELTEGLKEAHNTDNDWLGKFRKGHLDLLGLAYGIKICGTPKIDGIFMSHLDALADQDTWKVCVGYKYGGEASDLDEYFEHEGSLITAIKLHPDDGTEDHLTHQRNLTKLLNSCTSVNMTLFPSESRSLEEVLIACVEKFLGVSVVAVSHGPKISDRRIRDGHDGLII